MRRPSIRRAESVPQAGGGAVGGYRGGDLISRCCSPRFCQTRSCIGRMPMAFDRVELPVEAYFIDTDGMD